jgi:predicted TIM-barrel fold metal-dependent hydrolase
MEGKTEENTIKNKPGLNYRLIFSPILIVILLTITSQYILPQVQVRNSPPPGYRTRLRNYVDSMRIVDSHEHLFDPDLLKRSALLDFMILFNMHNFYDFVSAGLSPDYFYQLLGDSLTPARKWEIIEPYWKKSGNTCYNRISLIAADRLFGYDDISSSTVGPISDKIRKAYQGNWFEYVIDELCRFDYIIQDGSRLDRRYSKVKYVSRFTPWLTVRSKYRIDSIAVMQVVQIRTLEDFVQSLENNFLREVKTGIVGIKINMAYSRSLNVEKVKTEAARKIFRALMDNPEDELMTYASAKPLQDYMVFRLLELADKYKLPVAIHTGLQTGNGNRLENSNPLLLENLFQEFPNVRFSVFHGSYPYGGELATLAKTYPNVYIDMCWLYAISPSYSERYLHEWIETVPANKIMAFGGDYDNVENIFGELVVAKEVITRVLTEMVRERYMSEERARNIARMILHDNAVEFYHLR